MNVLLNINLTSIKHTPRQVKFHGKSIATLGSVIRVRATIGRQQHTGSQ